MTQASVASALAVVTLLTGCPRSEGDSRRSETRLAIARDALNPPDPKTRQDLDLAISEASKAIAYQNTNDEAYNVRGVAYLMQALNAKHAMEAQTCLRGLDADAQQVVIDEHLAKARPDFERATELAPDYSEAWSNRGNVAMAMGDHEAAIEYFKRALQDPIRLANPTVTRANLGSAFMEAGDYVAAAVELRQALQFNPGMCLARFWFGRVYFERSEWETAAEYLDSVVEDPACARLQEAPLYLMRTRLQQGLLDQARAAKAACLAQDRAPASCVASQCRSEGASL
ncbi:MAG: tetratricopeptide repeat protein [Kofleriaceae bacterium]